MRPTGWFRELLGYDVGRTHLGLGEVPDPAVDAALEEVHLRQDHLVI